MKNTTSLICVFTLLLCAVRTSVFADIVDPGKPPVHNGSLLPIILIAVAVIVVAVILWKVSRKKS